MKKTLLFSFVFIGLAFLISGCADSNPYSGAIEDAPGFFSGFWHGLILPINFVVSLFDGDVGVYTIENSGHWYDFGFVLGIILDIFGLNKASD